MSADGGTENEALRLLEAMRGHTAVQLARIAGEAETRDRLIQEEIDRRFAEVRRLMDERRDSSQRDHQSIQDEVDRRLEDVERLGVQRIQDLKEMMILVQSAAKEAVQAALKSAEKAVIVAQEASEKRLDAMNEFRKSLSDQTSTFIARPEHTAQYKALSDRVDNNAVLLSALELRLTSRLDTFSGQQTGAGTSVTDQRAERGFRNANISAVIAGVATLVAIVSLVLYYAKK